MKKPSIKKSTSPGGDCNSFPTQRAAEEFAEGLGGGRVDVGDIIVEKE